MYMYDKTNVFFSLKKKITERTKIVTVSIEKNGGFFFILLSNQISMDQMI